MYTRGIRNDGNEISLHIMGNLCSAQSRDEKKKNQIQETKTRLETNQVYLKSLKKFASRKEGWLLIHRVIEKVTE